MRRAFYSFHFDADNWRAAQVRNMGVLEGNTPVSDNDWESIKRGGDAAIERWINSQLTGRSCTIVLIGSRTAGRKWINYEIRKSWDDGMGLFGVYIHNLLDRHGHQVTMGQNPFTGFKVNGTPFDQIVSVYNPPFTQSTDVYAYIKENLESWTRLAIASR